MLRRPGSARNRSTRPIAPEIHRVGMDTVPGDRISDNQEYRGTRCGVEAAPKFALGRRPSLSTRLFALDLILASGSPIRHQMLTAAGVAHRVIPSEVDEWPLKDALLAPDDVTLGLARMKAMACS